MKKIFLSFLLSALFIFEAKADEGMWLPYMLSNKNIEQMQALGCKLSAEEIFSFNKSSIKDAIVQFGGGCTGELISAEGLLLTNHHCGLGQAQAHSSPENDYLTHGFWAMSKKQELPNPGLTVSFLASVEDITEIILKGIDIELKGNERARKIDENRNTYIKEILKKDDSKKYSIVPFYHENQYLLFAYDVYKDVRLVGCPPWGIGKFGADTDNWTWPRQKGDFMIFRVYTAPDGSPAEYSVENIPMKSKHFLPISIKGIQENDYAMILGYPGSTNRYSPSQSVEMIINHSGPSLIKCRTEKLNVIRTHSDASPEVFIKYASKQASVSNYWKYYIGQVKQLQRNKVVEKRIELETQFAQWVKQDKEREKLYGAVLTDFKNAYDTLAKYEDALVYHREAGYRGGEAITFAGSRLIIEVNNLLEKKSSESAINRYKERHQAEADKFFKDYDYELDREVTIALFNLFYKNIESGMQPDILQKQGKEGRGDFENFVTKAFQKSVFTSRERFNKWLEKPTALTKDPIYQAMRNISQSHSNLLSKTAEANQVKKDAERLYMKGLMEMQPDKDFCPDANFTMRLTYGKVKGYKPADAVTYDFESTLEGAMEKEIPGNWEFDIPAKLKELYEKKDYGVYGKGDQLIVNFITDNDITGGNSGSAVIDGEGNLIGLAFDGNWEAMSGDISFDKDVKRTISMDARYILFVIDKFANAQNIMQELKIVR